MNLESSIQEFLNIASELQQNKFLFADEVLNRVLQFYREVRIIGTELDEDGDMLLLQWGVERPVIFTSPIDLRNIDIDLSKFDKTDQRYLDFTRQVCAPESEDSDLDGELIQMSLELIYGPARGNEKLGNLWIDRPDNVAAELENYRNVAFIKEHYDLPAIRLVARVNYCG